MNSVMRSILSHMLMRDRAAIEHGDSLAERVVERLLNNALAGDLESIRFIFLVMDGEPSRRPLSPAGRPLVDVLDPEE